MVVHPDIDQGNPFDWGLASGDYALYRDIYPPAFYQRLLELGLCTRGQRVLDLGTGTGVLPRNLYRYGARFVGIDSSPQQIEQARRLSAEAGMEIEYRAVPAEEMDFAANSFDAAIACQCFFYFDVHRVVPKIKQALVNRGLLGILFLAWLPGESEIARRSEELVLGYNPNWTGHSMTRRLFDIPPWLEEYSFSAEHNIGFAVEIPFTKQAWNGRMKSCRGIGASLSPQEVAAFEQEHLALLDSLISQEPFSVPHYATMLILKNNK